MVERGKLEKVDGLENLHGAIRRTAVNRDYPLSGFIASQDIMDQLRLECSALPPEHSTLLTDMASEIIGVIEEKYGKFIPEETLEQSAGIVDRLLCISPDMYNTFSKAWEPQNKRSKIDKSLGRFYSADGRIITFHHPSFLIEQANRILSEQNFKRFGGKHQVYTTILSVYLTNILGHEIIHEYENHSGSWAFSESGTEYYAQEISRMDRLSYGRIVGYGKKPKAFYAQLVDKYGDDTHRTFFGTPVRNSVNNVILSEFTPETVSSLFPKKIRSV